MSTRTTDTGWTVTAYPERCIHREKSTLAEWEAFVPERAWHKL
jgi:hypothetical protein